MPGGARSMKGEKQMIYKNITFKADPFSYNLEFDDRITLVGGNSGTGKTVLYEMLEDLRLTNEYKAIKLFNYKSDNFSESIEQCRDNFIVVDNADNLINDEVRRFINFEPSNQYMLFLRNCDGLNVSDKSFNRKAFVQLRILELLLSDNIGHIELDECNKPALIKIDLTQSNSELKREFMIKWTHCISQVDGITRYLKYMNKKMMRYQRLITNVTDVKELKEIVENIKD